MSSWSYVKPSAQSNIGSPTVAAGRNVQLSLSYPADVAKQVRMSKSNVQ